MPAARPTHRSAPAALVWTALGIVYLVWGSTYLAIRIAIETLPPFLMAGTRFLVAGAVLLALAGWHGWGTAADRPGWPQWRAAAVVGAALLLGGNGGVVWSEQRIASGVAALLVATLPLWMAILDRLVFGQRLGRQAVLGLVLGFAGLILLVGPLERGGIDPLGALVCTLASLSWAAGSLYARGARLPHRPLLATGMQMLVGGGLLTLLGLAAGEWRAVQPERMSFESLLALGYLIVFGSLIAFSAYVWLLGHAPVSLVATYAYVNPVVAVALGWALANEPITSRMVLAGAVIVAAVALIAGPASPPAAVADDPEAGARAAS